MNREESKKFNENLNIPIKWQSGFKPGINDIPFKRTKPQKPLAHIQILEDCKSGRLKRSAGEFLCGYVIGLPFVEHSHYQKEDDIGKYDAQATCPVCLKLAERWL